MIQEGNVRPEQAVRDDFERLRPLEKLKVEKRGWTLDVLQVVHSLKKTEFSLQEVYQFEEDLSRLHPANRNIQPKIRQQLQVLRDLGFVEFLGAGKYRTSDVYKIEAASSRRTPQKAAHADALAGSIPSTVTCATKSASNSKPFMRHGPSDLPGWW